MHLEKLHTFLIFCCRWDIVFQPNYLTEMPTIRNLYKYKIEQNLSFKNFFVNKFIYQV